MMKFTLYRAYLAGHSGRVMPRQVRRILAGTELHRAWLLGSMGFFEQDGNPLRPGQSLRACGRTSAALTIRRAQPSGT